jgi:hypothetical protein
MTSAKLDTLITGIAVATFGLTPLATRLSDCLDFHEPAVWQIRRALLRAFEARRRCGTNSQPTTLRRNNS